MSECSSLLIFTARNDPIESVERFISERKLDVTAAGYANYIRNSYNKMDNSTFLQFATNQAYIALGVGNTTLNMQIQ